MSEARRIGDILPGIIARAERMASFQSLINDVAEPADRKKMIMAAHMGDLITDDETALLIEVYGLESA